MDCRLPCAAFVLAIAMVSSGAVHATDDSAKGAARELANQAKSDFDAGNFEEAGSKFQRAYDIAKVPTLAVWAARSLVKRGHLVAASELYRQATLLAPNDLWVGDAQQQAQADAERELGELQPRIPRLRIRVEGPTANEIAVTVDGAKMAVSLLGIDLPTDPGRRHIVGKRGAEAIEQTVDLAEGGRKEAVLSFSAVPPAPILGGAPPAPAVLPAPALAPAPVIGLPPPAPAPSMPAALNVSDSVDTRPSYQRGLLILPYGGMLVLIDGAKHNRGSYTDEIFSALGCRFGLLVGGHLKGDYSLSGEFAVSSWAYKIASDAGKGLLQFDLAVAGLRHVRWSWGELIAGPKVGWSVLHSDWDFHWIGGPLVGARTGLLAAPADWLSVGVLADIAYLRVLDANNIFTSLAVAILF